MKRVLKYLILILCTAAVAVCLAALFWLAGTTDGARWLMAAVSRQSGLEISAQSVEGNLAKTLRLTQLSVRWPEGHLRVEQVRLNANPLPLLTGNIRLHAISLKNVAVEDNAPDKPPVLKWPKVSRFIAWFGVAVDRLDLENLSYRRLEEKPLKVAGISASIKWYRGYLSVTKIHLSTDIATVTGDIRAGFLRPLLDIRITVAPSHPAGGMELFRLNGKFLPAKHPEQIAGTVHLTGLQKQQDALPLWKLSLDAAMTQQGFPLRNIRLSRKESEGTLSARGLLTFKETTPYLSLNAQAQNIDWTTDFNIPAKLSGSLVWEGTAREYRGHFAFVNTGKSWQNIRLEGDYSGNDKEAKIDFSKGSLLNGSLAGHLDFDWRDGMTVNADLQARNLDPAAIEKDWSGQINVDLEGRIQTAENKKPQGEISLLLKQSRLHGQSLTGNLRGRFTGEDIRIQDLSLQGRGFRIQAAGAVRDKLAFTCQISDLAGLAPQASGSLSARGWMRRRDGKFSGTMTARALALAVDELTMDSADIQAAFDDQGDQPVSIQATAQNVGYGLLHADTVIVKADGTKKNHMALARIRAGQNEVNLDLAGSYDQKQWRGTISRLEGRDKTGTWRLREPSGMIVSSSGITLDPLTLSGGAAETVKVSCRLAYAPLAGFVFLDWNDVNLKRAGAWLNQDAVTGLTRGTLRLNLLPGKRIDLTAKASLQGALMLQGKTVGIRQGLLNVDADEKGTHADLNIALTGGGTLSGTFVSSSPAALSLPDNGRFSLRMQDFEPALLGSIFPGQTQVLGKMTAEASGRLLPGNRLTMTGRASVSESKVRIKGQKSDININLKEASLDWDWHDDAVSGGMLLRLSEYGKLEGRFRLPVAARLPLAFNEQGTIQASLSGTVMEQGALTSLFPGLIQESGGRLDLDLKLQGTWKEPHFEGEARLSQAGGYLPSAGITIKDAGAYARFADNRIIIESIKAFSGPGQLEGNAVIQLKDGKVAGFEGRLEGTRFQTIYFPELQVQSSPKLAFSGTPQKVTITGEILLPEVAIVGTQSSHAVEASPDVVREGQTKPAARKLPFDLDAQVKVLLGDSVSYKAGGIDAQLGGNVDLQVQALDKIFGRGEIRVIKGRFQTYGVNLDIVRGRLYYTGGPINRPSLDILALKTIGDVKAGVTVTGKLQSPLIKLYSDPAMQDTDILAYIVLGHPLGSSNTEQANLLAVAAGALLSSSQAEGLQSQIKRRLGLSSFDISAGVVEKNGRMGYKTVKVAPSGTGASSSTDSVGETMVVVGRYLTPNLYVSYGRSLFSGSNLFSLRYNLSKRWQVESQTGESSGVDIYYKLEFN